MNAVNVRRLLSLSVVLASALVSARATATDVQACLNASEKGQRARAAGKLREARDQFLVCGGDSCPAIVRRDCTQWQSEIVGMLPSVVFGAKDKQGRDLFDVTVTMDGETIVKKLDGKSVAVDPGPHTFKFEVAGQPPVVERALVKEGEKTRVITVTFAEGGAAATDGTSTPPTDPDRNKTTHDKGGGHTVFPWIAVGLGVATIGVGVVVIVTSPALPPQCNADSKMCAKIPGESAATFAQRQEDAGRHDSQPTEGLIIGAIGLGVAAAGLLWHFLEPTGEKSGALRFTPYAGPSGAGGTLGASF